MSLFSINGLTVAHKTKVLLSIDQLDIPKHKSVAIIGANGAGKSTLIHALLGQVSGCKVAGEISCQGKPVAQQIKQGKVAWVGQHEQYTVPLTVRDYVLLGTMPSLAWYQQPNKQAVATANDFLAEFDLSHLAECRIQTLSGGEKQRMSMVRALMQQTKILLLDEPTNHLDVKHQRKLFGYLQALTKHKTSCQSGTQKSIIMVLHSLTDAYKYADYVIALSEGKLLAHGTPQIVMTKHNLKQMYGVTINMYDTNDGKVFV